MADPNRTREAQAHFERLVARLLSANGFTVEPYPHEALEVRGFDFIAQREHAFYLVEAKFYRTASPQASLIETAAARLQSALKQNVGNKGMLVVSASLPVELKDSLQKHFGLVLVDRSDLATWAAASTELRDELRAVLEEDEPQSPSIRGRAAEQIVIIDIPEGVPLQEDTRGTELCQELRGLAAGKTSWKKYEELCERILKYLFANDLLGWHSQKRTDDGLNRYDFVCRIRPVTDFWSFLIHHLDSRYALFEFKNYTGQIKQGQMLTTEKYLLEKGLRRAAIIFSRKGASREATTMAQGAMREQGKLMLVVNDDQVCEMLHMKERGEDPTDFLFDLADDFLLSLPR